MAENTTLHDQRLKKNLIVLGNANTLATAVLMNVMGNDVSSSLGGNRVTLEMACTLVQARIKRQLALPV